MTGVINNRVLIIYSAPAFASLSALSFDFVVGVAVEEFANGSFVRIVGWSWALGHDE